MREIKSIWWFAAYKNIDYTFLASSLFDCVTIQDVNEDVNLHKFHLRERGWKRDSNFSTTFKLVLIGTLWKVTESMKKMGGKNRLNIALLLFISTNESTDHYNKVEHRNLRVNSYYSREEGGRRET